MSIYEILDLVFTTLQLITMYIIALITLDKEKK